MSCCKPETPKQVLALGYRVAFGVSLALIGLAHYMAIQGFAGMVAGGLGPLTPLGTLWAYILPALQIVGGVLIATKQQPLVGAWCATVALASIPVGMLLKPIFGGVSLPEVMPMAQNGLMWLLIMAVGMKLCCESCPSKNQ